MVLTANPTGAADWSDLSGVVMGSKAWDTPHGAPRGGIAETARLQCVCAILFSICGLRRADEALWLRAYFLIPLVMKVIHI